MKIVVDKEGTLKKIIGFKGKELVIPTGVHRIKSDIFEKFSLLDKLVVPAEVDLDSFVFSGCKELEELILEGRKEVTDVGDGFRYTV